MEKDVSALPSQSANGLNSYGSTFNGNRSARKETTFREWLVDNQIGRLNRARSRTPSANIARFKRTNLSVGITLPILVTLMAVHNLYPSLRAYTTPFFQMSYYQPSTGRYRQGWDDIYLVISSIIGFTAVRAISIDWIFRPITKRAGLKKKASIRCSEQAWMLVYYGVFWPLGMVSPWERENRWQPGVKGNPRMLTCWCMIIVYLVAFRLLAQLQSYLDGMAVAGDDSTDEVVLAHAVILLVPADSRHQH